MSDLSMSTTIVDSRCCIGSLSPTDIEQGGDRDPTKMGGLSGLRLIQVLKQTFFVVSPSNVVHRLPLRFSSRREYKYRVTGLESVYRVHFFTFFLLSTILPTLYIRGRSENDYFDYLKK